MNALTELIFQTRVIAEDYDFEAVRELTVVCERCSAKIPDATLERLISEQEFPHICPKCGHVAKLSRDELDRFADSLTFTIQDICAILKYEFKGKN